LTASVSNATGSVQFLDGSSVLGNVPIVDGKALLSATFDSVATRAVTARILPDTGTAVTSTPIGVTIESGTPPVFITATGSAQGTPSQVTVRNADGSVRFILNPFAGFTGVTRVKVADVTGDGQLDVVTVPGFGGGPHIIVYDGETGEMVYQKIIFEERFRGGLSLDVGDAKSLGYAQILVGAGNSGGPRVSLLDATTDKVLLNYFAYDSGNRGGVSVAISDLRGGNLPNIITGAGAGLSPNINVYNPFTSAASDTPESPTLFGTFVAGSASDTSGVRIGAGPLIDDTRRDILVGDLDTGDLTNLSESFNPLALGVFGPFVGPGDTPAPTT